MIWWIYNILFAIGYALLLPKFLWRMWRRGGYRTGFLQRFGLYSAALKARLAERPRIWIHAVSVGEVYVARRLMDGIRGEAPETAFILTTTTSTGHQVAAESVSAEDVLLYFPIDIPVVVRRAWRHLRPTALLLTENELWPNWLRELKRRNTPVALVNGRISQSSYRGYRALRWLTRRALPLVDLFLVQSHIDGARLIELGAPSGRVRVVGSVKYDVVQEDPDAGSRARAILERAGIGPNDRIVVGGSTWPGEEKILLAIYRELKPCFPSLKLVLVPRHVERRAAVEADIARAGLVHVRRSAPAAAGAPRPADILLVDTTGELKTLYAMASVIFVGKSLTQTGGQNIIEPALFGKAIVVGPHLENFPDVAEDFLSANAIVQVADAAQLAAELKRLLGDRSRCDAYGQRARQVVERKRGAIDASVHTVRDLLLRATD